MHQVGQTGTDLIALLDIDSAKKGEELEAVQVRQPRLPLRPALLELRTLMSDDR